MAQEIYTIVQHKRKVDIETFLLLSGGIRAGANPTNFQFAATTPALLKARQFFKVE
jgi:hypothetical protein